MITRGGGVVVVEEEFEEEEEEKGGGAIASCLSAATIIVGPGICGGEDEDGKGVEGCERERRGRFLE